MTLYAVADDPSLENTAAQFTLWLPRFEAEGDAVVCTADVVPANVNLIDRGDPALVASFAGQLGFDGAEIVEWSLTGFNTPFYARDIDGDDLDDCMRPAWRLRMVVRGSGKDAAAPGELPGPTPSWAVDETWLAHQSPWDWGAHETVVVTLDGPTPDLDFLDALGRPLGRDTFVHPGRLLPVGEARLSLGRVALPEQLDDVFDVVFACHREAFVVHRDDAYAFFYG